MGSGAELRRKLWAAAMGGAHVMVLDMDIETTPPDDLYACGRLARFMEAIGPAEMSPRDGPALGDTEYVLAGPGESYIAYASDSTEGIGLRSVEAGDYSFVWLDCDTGQQVYQHRVQCRAGDNHWPKPEGIGGEVAVCITRR